MNNWNLDLTLTVAGQRRSFTELHKFNLTVRDIVQKSKGESEALPYYLML